MGTGAEVALLAITAASTAYQMTQSGQKPDMPQPPNNPVQPKEATTDLAASVKASNEAAQTAGGQNQEQQGASTGAALGSKTLLGQ